MRRVQHFRLEGLGSKGFRVHILQCRPLVAGTKCVGPYGANNFRSRRVCNIWPLLPLILGLRH